MAIVQLPGMAPPFSLLPDRSSTLPPALNAALRVSVGVTVVPDYFAFADLIPG
jgi:hypothetical protein